MFSSHTDPVNNITIISRFMFAICALFSVQRKEMSYDNFISCDLSIPSDTKMSDHKNLKKKHRMSRVKKKKQKTKKLSLNSPALCRLIVVQDERENASSIAAATTRNTPFVTPLRLIEQEEHRRCRYVCVSCPISTAAAASGSLFAS